MSEQKKQQIALLEFNKQFIDRKPEFISVLPSNCTFDRFSRIIRTAVLRKAELLDADRKSLLTSCIEAAQDGLLPDGREATFNVYKNTVKYMPMYTGILKKVRNSGELASISAHVVYENDKFDYCLGDDEHITHKPVLNNKGNAICAYVIVRTRDEATYRTVMSVEEIEEIRKFSPQKNGNAWCNHWGEMAKKTVIRRISKLLPMNSEIERIIHRDDHMFEFENEREQEVQQVIDIRYKDPIAAINQEIKANDTIKDSIIKVKVIEPEHLQVQPGIEQSINQKINNSATPIPDKRQVAIDKLNKLIADNPKLLEKDVELQNTWENNFAHLGYERLSELLSKCKTLGINN